MKTDRQLLPTVDGLKPPAAVANAAAELDKAKERKRKAGAEVRKAELAVRSAEGEDAKRRREAVAADKPTPKPTKPDREAALEDAKGRAQAAAQLEREAEARLAEEIRKAQPELIQQVDTGGRAERIFELLDQVGQEIAQLEDEAGAIRTVSQITDERRRGRGHEPLRLARDRHTSPEAHLSGLRAYVDEVAAVARRFKDEAPRKVAA